MLGAALLAGIAAAKAIVSVSTGAALIPTYTYVDRNEQIHVVSLPDKPRSATVQAARNRLARNDDHATSAALVVDGYLDEGGSRIDSLMIQVQEYGPAGRDATVVVPYRPAKGSQPFEVYRPRFLSFHERSNRTIRSFADEFWRGVKQDAGGAAYWKSHTRSWN